MRARMSCSCFWLSARVSSFAKCASGTVAISRCGLTNAAACGIATCACISIVVALGLTSRPGRPCLRAAVGAYLFQGVIVYRLFVSLTRTYFARSFPRKRESRVQFWVPAFAGTSGLSMASPHSSKHAEVLRDHRVVELQLRRRSAKHHASGVDDDDIVGE